MYSFLRKIPFFSELSNADLERVCAMAEEVQIAGDETLFVEGSRGDRAYVIQDGELEILKAVGDRQVLVAVRRAGEVIGEMALIEDAPRGATVRTRRAMPAAFVQLSLIHISEPTRPY